MDFLLPPVKSSVVAIPTSPRLTPTPVRPFADVLTHGASALVRGAEAAMQLLPGAPIMATALRTGIAGPLVGARPPLPGGIGIAPEGPGGGATAGAGTGASEPGVEASMAQSREMNLYFLQIQEEVNAQNRRFTTLSNVLKAEHDTVKTAIGNIR